jgi:hypothetical protein
MPVDLMAKRIFALSTVVVDWKHVVCLVTVAHLVVWVHLQAVATKCENICFECLPETMLFDIQNISQFLK